MSTTLPVINWYRTPVSTDVLDDLARRHNLRALGHALGHFAIFCATGAACLYAAQQHAWGWLALALFAHGAVCSFFSNANHELLHGTPFTWEWVNRLFLNLFSLFTWINPHYYWASHTEHHKYTLHQPADMDETLPKRLRWSDFLKESFFDPVSMWKRIYGNLRLSIGKMDEDWLRYLFDGRQRRFAMFNWSRGLVAFHLAVLAVSIWQRWWMVPVVVSLAPMFGRVFFYLTNHTQHTGLMESVNDFRLSGRTIYFNPVLRFFYWHMNYHIEHHMYPAVPFYNLHKLHDTIKHDLPPTLNGLIPTWQQIIHTQYRQERDESYRYRQPLPGDASPKRDAPAKPVRRVPERPQSAHLAVMPLAELTKQGLSVDLKVLECKVCGFIYDEALGMPEEGIPPGTRWADIPDDWRCPDCNIRKAMFKMVERV